MSTDRSTARAEPFEAEPQADAEVAGLGTGPEFPGGRTLWSWIGEAERASEGETRREFLQLAGFGLASSAVLAAAGCAIPERRALPLVDQPEELVPGVASWYATTCGGCAAGCGLLVKVRDGRPIKIEGNPDSPLSRGGTCAVGQATVLSLYDPARFAGPRWLGEAVSWRDLDTLVVERLREVSAQGRRIAILAGPALGPTFRQLLREWEERFPGSRPVVHEALPLTGLRRAAQRVWGSPLVPHFRLDRARLVIGLDADFLGTWLSPVELTRQYSEARRPRPREASGGEPAARLRHVQIETQMTLTGSNADLRIPVRPSELPWVALALYAAVARSLGEPVPPLPSGAGWEGWPRHAALSTLAAELVAARGSALVACGTNDPDLQTLVLRLNQLLGAEGATLEVETPSLQSEGDEAEVLRLLADLEAGRVGALLVLDANPVYDHPLGARFEQALVKVPLVVSLADRPDETNAYAHAVAPGLHFLESWDDAEPVGGLLQLRQPAIAPLFDGRAPAESLLRWMGNEERWYDRLRDRWRREVFAAARPADRFDALWDGALERGVFSLARPTLAPRPAPHAPLEAHAAAQALAARPPRPLVAGEVELYLYPSVALRDGRWGNNPWLQELPDPLAKMTWGNWAALAPGVAARSGIEEGEVLVLEGPGGSLELPAVAQPGLADGVVAVALGYGRTGSGKVAEGVGRNAFPLRPLVGGLAANAASGFRLRRSGRREALARTQQHFQTEGRPIVREIASSALGAGPEAEHTAAPARGLGEGEARADLWPEYEKPEHFWGMAIDLSACTGCSACVVACQAENNVAVVGRDEVARGREMHWIRVDRYYDGPPEAPRAAHQPMMCQHCDHAPCETVCPVLATVHSSDGLNQQVYNRCIGTRYCANNCPYKVRRFNWFRYAENERFDFTMNGELPRMVLNPDVGIRSRGVMEKCSLCIQRIQEGKLAAKRRGEPLADGAIRTACQQACPAEAIVFGDRKDPGSGLARQERDPRFYRVLESLGTRPGVGYLARVRQLEAGAASTGEEA